MGQVRHLKEEHLSGMRGTGRGSTWGSREHLTEGAPVKEGAFQRDGCTSRCTSGRRKHLWEPLKEYLRE